MSAFAQLTIHASQFPENVRRDLIESLRARKVNHKFLYDSYRQTQKWLALHQACSPARTDPDCAATYDRAFQAVAGCERASGVHLLGLGCGGGQKDTRLLQLLKETGASLSYAPVDVSAAMVLVARQRALSVIPPERCFGLVCDLASNEDPVEALGSAREMGIRQMSEGPCDSGTDDSRPTTRLITFFGMMPNFEPPIILPRLAGLLQSGDFLLLSANLAPGEDYDAGMQRILPQYDNAPTRDWLLEFLIGLGIDPGVGNLRFAPEDVPGGHGLKRVSAYFEFIHAHQLQVDDERFDFLPGDSLRLFFSYRHTPALVESLLDQHGLRVLDQWITRSAEEGVFLCESLGSVLRL